MSSMFLRFESESSELLDDRLREQARPAPAGFASAATGMRAHQPGARARRSAAIVVAGKRCADLRPLQP